MATKKDKKDVFEEENRERAREEERDEKDDTKDLKSDDVKEGEAQTRQNLQDAYE